METQGKNNFSRLSVRISDRARIVSYLCKLRTLSLLLIQCSFPFPDEVNNVLDHSRCIT